MNRGQVDTRKTWGNYCNGEGGEVNDGVSFCYCAYFLRNSGWSEKFGFLNGAHQTKTCGKSRSYQRFSKSRKKIKGN